MTTSRSSFSALRTAQLGTQTPNLQKQAHRTPSKQEGKASVSPSTASDGLWQRCRRCHLCHHACRLVAGSKASPSACSLLSCVTKNQAFDKDDRAEPASLCRLVSEQSAARSTQLSFSLIKHHVPYKTETAPKLFKKKIKINKSKPHKPYILKCLAGLILQSQLSKTNKT